MSGSAAEERFKISVSTSNKDAPSLFLEPSEKTRKINSFETWLQAFHILVGVYTSKYPSEAPALMKYGDIVRDLASRGHNWAFYDENFRFLKQSHKQLLQCGEIHWELWLRSRPVQHKKASSFSNNRGHSSKSNNMSRHVPRGYCFRYHKGGDCDGCDHKHFCFKCEGNHRGFQCNFRTQSNFLPLQRHTKVSPGQLPVSPLPTPIRFDRFAFFLDGYPLDKFNYLMSGFKFGFSLHFEGLKQSFEANNFEHLDVVHKKLTKELDAHRLAGPFSAPPFSNFRISPLGVVPKKTPGEFRLIHHLSFPKGMSVNDGFSSEHTTVSYATIAQAIHLIKKAGPGCFLAKTDIRNAFRLIPICQEDYDLLGIKWKGVYYYDRCMPMGCSSS